MQQHFGRRSSCRSSPGALREAGSRLLALHAEPLQACSQAHLHCPVQLKFRLMDRYVAYQGDAPEGAQHGQAARAYHHNASSQWLSSAKPLLALMYCSLVHTHTAACAPVSSS